MRTARQWHCRQSHQTACSSSRQNSCSYPYPKLMAYRSSIQIRPGSQQQLQSCCNVGCLCARVNPGVTVKLTRKFVQSPFSPCVCPAMWPFSLIPDGVTDNVVMRSC